MKRMFVLFAFLGLIIPTKLSAQGEAADFVPGKLFLKVHNGLGVELPQFRSGMEMPGWSSYPELKEICEQYGVKAVFKPFKTRAEVLQNTYEVHFDRSADAWALIEDLGALPFVEYAEPIAIHKMDYTPNDLSFLQWHLTKINAQAAWDISKGNRSVVVAVVDDAVKMNHNDLSAQIWTNPGEIPNDSIDNDGNGWIDDVHGYDLAEDDNDPSPPAGANNNDFSHGTHVAGIAAASTDNGLGIASIGFNVSIMPCKVKLDSTIGDPELQYTYYGVDYAIASKADVVNMSFGGPGYNSTFDNLLNVGRDSGLVFVASAGNTGNYRIQYPAGYASAISVASTNSSDRLSGFSTYHPSVDVSAPGSSIYSCTAGGPNAFGSKSGTSMSAPVVSGLLALMLSVDSTATPAQLRHCLESTTDNIDALNPDVLGYFGTGRVNAEQALQCLIPVSTMNPMLNGFSMSAPYPNPSASTFSLELMLPHNGHLQIQLIDLAGKEMGVIADGTYASGMHHITSMRGLTQGVYLFVATFEGSRKTAKIQVFR